MRLTDDCTRKMVKRGYYTYQTPEGVWTAERFTGARDKSIIWISTGPPGTKYIPMFLYWLEHCNWRVVSAVEKDANPHSNINGLLRELRAGKYAPQNRRASDPKSQ